VSLADGQRLATYLAEQTGIQLSGSQIRRILKRKSIVTFGQSTVWRISKIQLIELNFEKITRYLAITKETRAQVWFWTKQFTVIRRKN